MLSLPDDTLLEIAVALDIEDVLCLRRVCRRLKGVTQERLIWLLHLHRFDQDGIPIPHHIPYPTLSSDELESMAIRAYHSNQVWTRTWRTPRLRTETLYEWRWLSGMCYPPCWSVLPGGMWLSLVSETGIMRLCNVDWEGFPVFSAYIEPAPKGYELGYKSLFSGWKSGGKEAVILYDRIFSVTDKSNPTHITTYWTLIDIWVLSIPSRRDENGTPAVKHYRRLNLSGGSPCPPSIGEDSVAAYILESADGPGVIHLLSLDLQNEADVSFVLVTDVQEVIYVVNLIPGYIMATTSRFVRVFPIPNSDSEKRASTDPVYSAYELHISTDAFDGSYLECSSVTGGYTPLRGYQLFPLLIVTRMHILAILPTSFCCSEAETSDPYILTVIGQVPEKAPYINIGSEGRRMLWKHGYRSIWAREWDNLKVLSFYIQVTTDGDLATGFEWKNHIQFDASILDVDALDAVILDEVSGRLYEWGSGKNLIKVHNLY